MSYFINEVFTSVQGEGARMGEASTFVRFSGCNYRCAVEPGEKSPGGFDCDTEFESGRRLSLDAIDDWIEQAEAGTQCEWLILTGGEPALQLDGEFCEHYRAKGRKLAVETNGSILLPNGASTDLLGAAVEKRVGLEVILELFPFDWIVVSPKCAEHAVRQLWAHELRYVRGYGQGIPRPAARALTKYISPTFNGQYYDADAVQWCIKLCRENPDWRLSIQQHKILGAR